MTSRTRLIARARRALLLTALCLGMLPACAKTTGSHSPSTSTETGNPPVIDPQLLALVVSADGVAIVGEPGAVMPGGAEVEVEVVGSGDLYSVTAEEDGSFQVAVMGGEDDVYLVRAVPAEGDDAATPVVVYRGGAQVGGPDEDPLSCQVRDEVIEAVLDAARMGLDRGCMVDSDCVSAPPLDGCYYSGWSCGRDPVSQLGRRQLQASVDALNRSVCDGYEDQGCFDDKVIPGCPMLPPAVCNAGQCELCTGDDCEGLPNGGDLTCEERDLAVEGAVEMLLAPTPGECMADSDCTVAPSIGDCFHSAWLCSAPVVSRTRAAQLEINLETVFERSICDGYADAGCWDDKPNLDCPLAPTAVCEDTICKACVDGECDPTEPDPDPAPASCAPHVVEFEGTCEPGLRYHWLGGYCVGLTGCSCAGPDCSNGFMSMEDCEAAYAGCQGTICGGFAGFTCEMDEYCAYVPGQLCGATDASATCQPMPDACDGNYDPVCGCDNQTHGNACSAAAAGVGIRSLGECP